MNWNKWVRQTHRWLSIAFTVGVIVNTVAVVQGKYSVWVGLLALLPAPRLRAIVVRPAAHSAPASPTAPLGGIRQHEQVQTGEHEEGERAAATGVL